MGHTNTTPLAHPAILRVPVKSSYELRWLPRLIQLMSFLSVGVVSHVLFKFLYGFWRDVTVPGGTQILLQSYGMWLSLNIGILWVFTVGCLLLV